MAKGENGIRNFLKHQRRTNGRNMLGNNKIDKQYTTQKDPVDTSKSGIQNGIINTIKRTKETTKNGLSKFRNIVTNSAKLMHVLMTIITNPITWVITAVFFFFLVFSSGASIFGQTDFAWNCAGGSGDGMPTGKMGNVKYYPNDQTKTAASIYSALKKAGYPDKVSFALLGNWKQESGFNPKAADGQGAHGLVQWMGGRWTNLHSFASKHNGSIYDLSIQLNYADYELHHNPNYKNAYQLASKASTIKEAAQIINHKYEGSADTSDTRPNNALEFAKKFGKGVTDTGDGATSNCTGQSGDTSSIVAFAKGLVYDAPNGNNSSANTSGNGWAQAKASYRQAYLKVGGPTSGAVGHLLASCDSFVATVMRNTVDKHFPWHATTQQKQYVKNSKKYKRIKCGQQQPGDIAFGEDSPGGPVQHIFIIGNKDATLAYAASYHQHVAIADGSSRYGSSGMRHGCTGPYLNGGDGHDYGEIYRYVG